MRLDVDDSLAWSEENIGRVTPKGNIIGATPGQAWSAGVIWVTEEQARLAEEHGWRIVSERIFSRGGAYLVRVQR